MRGLAQIIQDNERAVAQARRRIEQAREAEWPSTFHFRGRVFMDLDEARRFAIAHRASQWERIEERLHGPDHAVLFAYHDARGNE